MDECVLDERAKPFVCWKPSPSTSPKIAPWQSHGWLNTSVTPSITRQKLLISDGRDGFLEPRELTYGYAILCQLIMKPYSLQLPDFSELRLLTNTIAKACSQLAANMKNRKRARRGGAHSPKMEDSKKDVRHPDRKSLWGDYRQQSRWNKISFWSGIASILGLLLSTYALYDGRRTSLQLNDIVGQVTHEGSLLPGHKPDPPPSCGLTPEGAMRLYLGDVVFVVVGAAPTVALKIHKEPVLTLQRTDLGILFLRRYGAQMVR